MKIDEMIRLDEEFKRIVELLIQKKEIERLLNCIQPDFKKSFID